MSNYETDFVYNKLKRFGDRVKNYKKDVGSLSYTGIKAIDEPIGGILKSDLLLIGASTGAGKTTLSTSIAAYNALCGKSTYLFALEAYNSERTGEIEDRIKFGMIKDKYYSNTPMPKYLSFKKWAVGEYQGSDVEEYEKQVINEIDDNIKNNLFIRYRDKSDYGVKDFMKEIDAIQCFKKIDIIIIDHLHYFSMEGQIESQGIKNIMNKLRDIGINKQIPVVLIAHLRKTNHFDKSLVPGVNEFHGSSEITKNATAVVTVAREYESEQPKPHLFPTYFRLCKERFSEHANRYIFGCCFNSKTMSYDNSYKIYKSKKGGEDKEEITENERPHWAVNAKITGCFERKHGGINESKVVL